MGTAAVNPVSVVAQMGRGIAYPMRFDGGETAWNCPATPTDAEAESAAVGAMRPAVCTPIGSMPWARDDLGSDAPSLIAVNATDAVFEAAAANAVVAIAEQVPYVLPLSDGDGNAMPVDTTFDDATGELQIDVPYTFRNSTTPRSAEVVARKAGGA